MLKKLFRRLIKPKPAAHGYIEYVTSVMKENADFLENNAKDVYQEVLGLSNDVMHLVERITKQQNPEAQYARRPLIFFVFHILMPASQAIHINLLIGNIPGCFMQLRLLLESLAKCLTADWEYPDEDFFQVKLELLEEKMKRERKTITKLMEELEGSGFENAKSLWQDLSTDWLHTRGFSDRIVQHVIKTNTLPAHALTTPMTYTKDDLLTLEELRKNICTFRKMLKKAQNFIGPPN